MQDRQGHSPLQPPPPASGLLVWVPLGKGGAGLGKGGAGLDRAVALQEAEAKDAPQEEQEVMITLKRM